MYCRTGISTGTYNRNFRVVTVKSTVEISQNFVAFSEYINFNGTQLKGLETAGKHYRLDKSSTVYKSKS